jgi:hypothetical protein
LEAFFKERKLELLSIPTLSHKQQLPKLEFNALGPDFIPVQGNSNFMNPGKNFNLFEKMLTKTEDPSNDLSKKGGAVINKSMTGLRPPP